MASSTPSTIVLRSNNRDNGMERVHEAPCQAAVTIRPGMLCAYGTTNTIKPHAVAVGNKEGVKVAIDNWQATGSGIDTVYNAAETVRYLFASPGDVLYMLLKTGNNVAKGGPLESGGAGNLQVGTTPVAGTSVDSVVGYAEEALNNATGSDARIRVRIA